MLTDRAIVATEAIDADVIRIPAAGIEPATPGASGVMTTARERPFTEASMKGFI